VPAVVTHRDECASLSYSPIHDSSSSTTKHHQAGSSSDKQDFYMVQIMVSKTERNKLSLRINVVTFLLIIEWE
jgi:hypothetical protein